MRHPITCGAMEHRLSRRSLLAGMMSAGAGLAHVTGLSRLIQPAVAAELLDAAEQPVDVAGIFAEQPAFQHQRVGRARAVPHLAQADDARVCMDFKKQPTRLDFERFKPRDLERFDWANRRRAAHALFRLGQRLFEPGPAGQGRSRAERRSPIEFVWNVHGRRDTERC